MPHPGKLPGLCDTPLCEMQNSCIPDPHRQRVPGGGECGCEWRGVCGGDLVRLCEVVQAQLVPSQISVLSGR